MRSSATDHSGRVVVGKSESYSRPSAHPSASCPVAAAAVHRRFPSIYWPIRTVSRRALAEIHRRLSPRSPGGCVRQSVSPGDGDDDGRTRTIGEARTALRGEDGG